jgi:peroxiredoxin
MNKLFLFFFALCVHATSIGQPLPGTPAPEISLPNADGEVLKLSQLKGKVVLLDFWASWCGPCRQSNQGLSKLYKKYKSRGFEIFGVSLDQDPRAWSQAIKQDRITWLQVIDTKAMTGNKLMSTWNLRYIPSTFLIDKEGKIYTISPGKDRLGKILEELL